MSSAQAVLKTLSDVVRAHQDEVRARRANARDLEFEQVLWRVRRHRELRARRLSVLLGVAAVLGVAVWGHVQLAQADDPAGAEAARWAWIEAGSETTPVIFDDGSQLQLAPEARGRMGNGPGLAAHLMLEAGYVSGQLRQSDSGPWRIDAGPFTLLSEEAGFTLYWDVERGVLRIAVNSGQLRLRDAGGELRVLDTGARLELAR